MTEQSLTGAALSSGSRLPLAVVKVGGALLTGAAALSGLAAAVAARRQQGERLLIVASALHGVTDQLEAAAWGSLGRGPAAGAEAVENLRRRHLAVAGAAGLPAEVPALLADLEHRLAAVHRRGVLDDSSRAGILSFGERLSVPLVAAAIAAAGAPARGAAAEEVGLRARGPVLDGVCDLAASARGLAAVRRETTERVVVLTGFFGVDEGGDVVLFGRGGTDYTAGAVAACLGATVLELWKDVPGILSADPRIVPAAQLVPELSFAEVARLSSLGARVLHPRCLEPLCGQPTRVVVCAGGRGAGVGTRLVERRPTSRPRVMALAAWRGLARIRVEWSALAAVPGMASEIVGVLAEVGARFEAAGDAAPVLGFAVDDVDLPRVRRALRRLNGRQVEALAVEPVPALLGLVGNGVARSGTLRRRATAHLETLGVRSGAVAADPGGAALRFAVHRDDLERGLIGLHRHFF